MRHKDRRNYLVENLEQFGNSMTIEQNPLNFKTFTRTST